MEEAVALVVEMQITMATAKVFSQAEQVDTVEIPMPAAVQDILPVVALPIAVETVDIHQELTGRVIRRDRQEVLQRLAADTQVEAAVQDTLPATVLPAPAHVLPITAVILQVQADPIQAQAHEAVVLPATQLPVHLVADSQAVVDTPVEAEAVDSQVVEDFQEEDIAVVDSLAVEVVAVVVDSPVVADTVVAAVAEGKPQT